MESASAALPGSLPGGGADRADDAQGESADGNPDGRTKENPEAQRKEYDDRAAAEIVPGAERPVHGEGEGGEAPRTAKDAEKAADRLISAAEETATETVPAGQAEEKGVSGNAEEADSAMTYYSVLLQDRAGSLFECQRQTVYWETAEDHVTVHKSSAEHSLILGAGAYDVSARLLPENLHVDDGWIGRKNPGVVVKVVESGVLGAGVSSAGAAEKIYAGLFARGGWAEIDAVRNRRVVLLSEELLSAPHLRLAAMLVIAQTANPALFPDLDVEKAIGMLSEEAAGGVQSGIFWYAGREGV